MIYSTLRERTILFGGTFQETVAYNDTWSWTGSGWTQLSPSTSPSGRWNVSMAYDPVRQRAVMFGGTELGGGVQNDTWEWNGTNWTQMSPATVPPARAGAAITFDHVTRQIVMFGGETGSAVKLGDTWLWDGNDWTALSAASPVATHSQAAVSDPVSQRSFVFSGLHSGNTLHDDTYEFDGDSWQTRAFGLRPAARAGAHMAYDTLRDRGVIFGGLGQTYLADTWELTPVEHVASFTPFGSGCAGSAGIPALAPQLGSRPWSGEDFKLQLTGIPPGGQPFLLIGVTNPTTDLLFLGMPGCTAYLTPDILVQLVNLGGWAELTIPVPVDQTIHGLNLYAQCGVPDLGVNSAGLTASNPGVIVIGAR